MADCCSPSGYRHFFNQKEARRKLRQYRKKGLDGTAKQMTSYLTQRGMDDQTVLEVGGGIGSLQVELLQAGAAKAVNVDISSGYENVAKQLLAEEGLADKVERNVMDFAEQAEEFDTADTVVMNRVVCCYPFMEKLMTAASGRSKRFLAASFPRDRRAARIVVGFGNFMLRLRKVDFQAYVHSNDEIIAAAAGRGFKVAFDDQDFIWRTIVFERAAVS